MTVLQALEDALELARNGLQWYMDTFYDVVRDCDYEAMQQIDNALLLSQNGRRPKQRSNDEGKTEELILSALDYAVALAREEVVVIVSHNKYPHVLRLGDVGGPNYTPSVSWEQGGPILNEAKISLVAYECRHPKEVSRQTPWLNKMDYPETWRAATDIYTSTVYTGPTLLIAGLRCYVGSKLGSAVDIPEALLE